MLPSRVSPSRDNHSLKQGRLSGPERQERHPRVHGRPRDGIEQSGHFVTFRHFVTFAGSALLPEPGPGLTPEESEGSLPSGQLSTESPESDFAYLLSRNPELTPEESEGRPG